MDSRRARAPRLLGVLLALAAVGAAQAAERSLEPLARRFAPVVRQDTAGDQDYLTAFDFDGNWNGDDNWENQPHFPLEAWVYWSGLETSTHVFLSYAFFHPRDWTNVNLPFFSHENDLEGLLLVLEKTADGPRPVAAETVFHLSFLRYTVPDGYPAEDGDGELLLEGERPVVFVEAKGHGVKAWDGSEFPGGDGVVYRLGEAAEEPEHPDDRDVSYALVDIESTFWAHRFDVGPQGTFARTASFQGVEFGYALNGTRYSDHKANAPWGWEAEGLPRGTFFFDPAGMVAAHFSVPDGYASEYLPNPFTSGAEARLARRAGRFHWLWGGL